MRDDRHTAGRGLGLAGRHDQHQRQPAAPGGRLLALLGGCCEVCGSWTGGRLCAACRTRFAAAIPRCRCCGLALPAGVPRCGGCVHEPPAFERCHCAVDYGFPWDRVIGRFKYGAMPELAGVLADTLLRAAGLQQAEMPDLFAPVPLSPQRLAERGYDQAWVLARRLGRALQVPTQARVLQRRFDARHQAELSRRERLANLRGAFQVAPAARAHLAGRHVALVDDVLTTGATAQEAAAVLRAAGARRVDLWVVARTPEPDFDT